MKDDAQANNSIWMSTADTPSQPRLEENRAMLIRSPS